MKYIFILISIIGYFNGFSQSIAPSVINTASGGGTVGSTGVELYYNIGEPIVYTVINGSNAITQGFLQPDIVGEFDLSVTTLFQDESCLKKNDGFISIALNSAPSSALQLLYVWNPASICPTQNCTSIDSLTPGIYSVTILAINSSSVTIDSVSFSHTILANTEPCLITIYNGFTPDGDGINDNWIIENIDNYPTNTVSIFNRWGNKVWSTNNYSNSTNFWDGKDKNGAALTSGTYFYIIEIDGGVGVKKGWVELTENKN